MNEPPATLDFRPLSLLAELDPADKLSRYYEALKIENEKVNLVSRETTASGLQTLAAESLLPLAQIDWAGFDRYLDIGTGGGFPAIPILLTTPFGEATLLERGSRKSLALQRILRAVQVSCERVHVDQANFEEWVPERQFDLITLRLVKLTPKIWRKVVAALSVGGWFVYYSTFPDGIAPGNHACVSYCYQVGTPPMTKHFTILQKSH